MASKRVAQPDSSICVACGACIQACPRNAVSVWKGCYARVDSTQCVGCGMCAKICPTACIALKERVG